MFDVTKYPHLILLEKNPSYKDKLNGEAKTMIAYFDRQLSVIESHKIEGKNGAVAKQIREAKEAAYSELVPVSEKISEFISDLIIAQEASDAAAATGSPDAAQVAAAAQTDAQTAAAEANAAQAAAAKEVAEIFTDLEEMIEKDVEHSREVPLIGLFTDTEKYFVKTQEKNPNYGKKYTVVDGNRVYQE